MLNDRSRNLLVNIEDRMSMHQRPSHFRPDIEGLRGLAVLMVVLFHCGVPGLPGGFVGVDVFFVLSGFLITGMLVREIQETQKVDLLQFYARRVRRLFPAFALAVVVTLSIGGMIQAPQELAWAGHAGRAAALYVSNMFFDVHAGDYFAKSVKSNPLLHTWSLAVEEQFYVFWPLLLLLSLRWWKSTKALAGTLSVVTMISFGIGVWFTSGGSTFAFYELPARAWEFGIGGLAWLLPQGVVKLSRVPCAVGWLGIITVLGSAHFIAVVGDTDFPGWVALVPVMGTAMVLVAGTEFPDRGIGVVLRAVWLQVLGKLSYSWYLWHWPFLVLSEALFPTITLPGKLLVAASSLVVAGISYHVIENPIRYHPLLMKRPVWSVGLAGMVTLCVLGAAFASMRFADELAKEPRMEKITAAIKDVSRLPRERCFTSIQGTEVKTCYFGNMASEINIVLFGDSHAFNWFNPLERLVQSQGWKLTTVMKSSCHSFDIRPLGHKQARLDSCLIWRAEAIKQILAMRPTVVLLGNLTSSLGQRDRINPWVVHSLDELRDGTRRTLEALSGIRVGIMRDIPYFPYDIPTCLARSVRHAWYPNGSCEADRVSVLNPAVFEAEQAGARGLSNVHFIDATTRLCQGETCKPVQGDSIIYRDHHHLTGSFADSLMAILTEELLAITRAPLVPVAANTP